jgi:hypothetical protein
MPCALLTRDPHERLIGLASSGTSLHNLYLVVLPIRISIEQEYPMNVKATAHHVIDELPNHITMDDVIHALYVASKFDTGDREIRTGKGISDEVARKKLAKWQR